MVAITATNSATPSSLEWQGRARLEQARREADQAESTARQLRAQVDQAEQAVEQSQAKVSTLQTQVAQADSTYRSQIRNQLASAEGKQTQDVLAPVATVASNKFTFPENPLKSTANIWSTISQTSSTGRFVNQTV
jgi:multidrug resistance efflux pump